MIKHKKILIFLLLFSNNCLNAVAQDINPIKIEISMPKKEVLKYKDLNIQIKFLMVKPKIELPIRFCFNYENEYSNPDMKFIDGVIEIEKVNTRYKSKKIIMRRGMGNEMEKCLDSLGKERINILSIKNPLLYTKNICFNNTFSKGEYRCRLKYYLQEKQKKTFKLEFIYSNWLNFKVIAKQIDFSNFLD